MPSFLEEQIRALQDTLSTVSDKIARIENMIQTQEMVNTSVKKELTDLRRATVYLSDLQEIKFGSGNGAGMRLDADGLWFGKDKLATITGSNPPTGTAILMDGTIYAKGGATGTSTPATGTVTVVDGIVVAIS